MPIQYFVFNQSIKNGAAAILVQLSEFVFVKEERQRPHYSASTKLPHCNFQTVYRHFMKSVKIFCGPVSIGLFMYLLKVNHSSLVLGHAH